MRRGGGGGGGGVEFSYLRALVRERLPPKTDVHKP